MLAWKSALIEFETLEATATPLHLVAEVQPYTGRFPEALNQLGQVAERAIDGETIDLSDIRIEGIRGLRIASEQEMEKGPAADLKFLITTEDGQRVVVVSTHEPVVPAHLERRLERLQALVHVVGQEMQAAREVPHFVPAGQASDSAALTTLLEKLNPHPPFQGG